MSENSSTLLLLICSIIWGTAFVAQTSGMETMGPHTFTGIRLLLGGLFILPFAILINLKKKTLLNP